MSTVSGIQNSLDIQPKTKNAATQPEETPKPSSEDAVVYRALRGCFNLILEDLTRVSFINGFYETSDKRIQEVLKEYEGREIVRVEV